MPCSECMSGAEGKQGLPIPVSNKLHKLFCPCWLPFQARICDWLNASLPQQNSKVLECTQHKGASFVHVQMARDWPHLSPDELINELPDNFDYMDEEAVDKYRVGPAQVGAGLPCMSLASLSYIAYRLPIADNPYPSHLFRAPPTPQTPWYIVTGFNWCARRAQMEVPAARTTSYGTCGCSPAPMVSWGRRCIPTPPLRR